LLKLLKSACARPGHRAEENRKLKQLIADLSLDKHILQDVLSKKL